MSWSGSVRVGVMRLDLAVSCARSLKDRRRAVVGLRDRIRARFDVSCHEVHLDASPGRGRLLVTTGGLDAAVVGRVLDQVASLAASATDCALEDVAREVLPWPAEGVLA